MAWLSDDIYHSSNGDVWRLLRETPSGTILVRHLPNPSSGGNATDIPVEAFLAIDGPGPEHTALRLLLAKFAASDQSGPRATSNHQPPTS